MIRSKDGNGCCTSWCCCIRQQIAELWQRIEGTVRGVKMNGNIIEPDGDGIVDLDVNFPVDGAMDPTSVNPVQNRVVTDAILTERSERIEDDRRHDLQIQGLQTEVATKLTTPSGGVQGQVLGKGAQGVEWMDQQGGGSEITKITITDADHLFSDTLNVKVDDQLLLNVTTSMNYNKLLFTGFAMEHNTGETHFLGYGTLYRSTTRVGV